MAVSVDYTPGRLPPFWDRSVLFFANLASLFYGNEGATQELAAEVGDIKTYGGRLFPLLNLLFRGPDNLLVLESPPDESLMRYFTDQLGLDVPEFIVVHDPQYRTLCNGLRAAVGRATDDHAAKRIAGHPAAWIDGFVTDEVMTAAAEILGKKTIISPESSRRGNNKLYLHRFLEERGLPVFDTITVDRAGDIPAATAALRQKGYRQVVVKAQVGASGIGMLKLDASSPELDGIREYMFYEGPCLVQGWLEEGLRGVRLVGSPSMQMFLDERAVFVYDVTEQILSDRSVHQGNVAPPPYWQTVPGLEEQMCDQADAVGRWLHRGGYRGTASADFLVAERDGRIEVRLCEVNARVTGATYPAVLARRFRSEGSWVMRNLRFDSPISGDALLDALRGPDYLYTGGADGGVLPINFNVNSSGLVAKGQFLCLGTDEYACWDYLMQSANVLGVSWAYDRD